MSVRNDRLAILNVLKIQSGPLGNLWDRPFDGDEMNLHAPQNVLAETELRHLAATPYQLISPGNNSPIIGIFQDNLLGSYRFTRDTVSFTPREAMNLLMMYNNVDVKALRALGNKITSFDILSQIMPPMTMKYKTKLYNDKESEEFNKNNVLEIVNGKYLRGQIEKSVVGSGTKGILHRICNDFGNMAAADFIDNLQNIITEYMKSSSYSVGIKDLIADRETYVKILQSINQKKLEVQSVIDKVHLGIFENNTANTNIVEFETRVNNILNKATEESGKIGRESLDKNNRFVMIVNCGSKGSPLNISQMISCLGQQNVDAKRIPYGFDSRTLPHYSKFDDSPNARGFIESSYISGLKAEELFFHAMGGRIGLIDTACKSVTWETPIVIIENNKPVYIEIGLWIDTQLEKSPDKIQHFTERQMELMNIDNVYIPTTDEDGNVTWGEVSAITRHDPGNELYEIKTSGGRSVIVTESKSLLIWNPETKKMKEMLTPDICVGDCVPVTGELCEPPILIDSFVFNGEIIESKTREQGYYFGTNYKTDFIPDNMFIVSNNFIEGFLDGYKNVQNNSNSSRRMIEGIAMLYSRLSIYGKIVKISNTNWQFIIDDNCERKNNIVLDTIKEINKISTEKHPKVYDLTIPSTFNFGLANGLQVRDTATTGYIQRRLIKGLEDLKVEYDMTVRNSKAKIIQFSYGDDGFDPMRVENQSIPLVSMSIEDIYMHYDIPGFSQNENLLEIFTKGTISRIKKQKQEAQTLCKTYIEKMITMRNQIVDSVFKYKNENSIKIPIAFQSIITNIQGQLNLNSNSVVDITPLEAMQLIEQYFAKIKKIHFVPPTQLFEVMYYYYLSPKDLLSNKRFHRKALTVLLETVLLKYKQAIVHPGEMVGVVAGQSIGEPATQLSVLKTEKIKTIRRNKNTKVSEMFSMEIGKFCDEIIQKMPEYTFNTGHKDSVETLLDSLDDEYFIIGVDSEEKTHWNKISHVSRHIVNGDMMRVTTKSGRVIDTTTSHSHLVRRNQTVEPIVGADMAVGMRIPVAKHIDNCFIQETIQIGDNLYPLDRQFGWFIGAYLAEGCLVKKKDKEEATGTISISNISEYYIENVKSFASNFGRVCRVSRRENSIMGSEKTYMNTDTEFTYKPLADFIMNTCGTGSFVKRVPNFAFLAPNEFKAGLLSGYFDGDGNFMCDAMHHQIRVLSRSQQLIKDISLLLNYFDIFGNLATNFRNGANYYHLTISTKYAELYKQYIGSNLHSGKLDELINYNKRQEIHNVQEFIDKINGLGEIIAKCGKVLQLPGQSRNYGRWAKKDSIGRNTLQKYIGIFESHESSHLIQPELSILKQAANSGVIWDEVINIEIYTPEQTEYVYDFTVPRTQTFMTDFGIICHNTLNTFHNSGTASKSNVTRGVPRIEELLRLTKNPKNPSLTIHLKPLDELDQDKATKFANMIEHTKLGDVVKSMQICFDPKDNSTIILEDQVLLERYYEFENMIEECLENPDSNQPQKSKWIIRMEIDKEILLDKNITMDDIHFAIKNSYYGNEINCIYSDYNTDKLIFRIRMNYSLFNKKKTKNVEPLDQSDDIYILKNFQDNLLNNIILRGIQGIENVAPRKLQNMLVKEEGKFAKKDLWVLDTTGSNLLETLALDFIDYKRTYSNDIKEVFDVLGIEATRQILYNEFVEVMEFSDIYINYHHLSLLCDRMTLTKNLVSIFRSGILNDNIGPIAKATFEVHTEVFLNAARHAEFDHMRGVSASVLTGQYGHYGTNSFNLVLDIKEMENLEDAEVDTTDKNTEIESLFGFAKQDKSDLCSRKAIEIENNIINIKQSETGNCDDDYNMGF